VLAGAAALTRTAGVALLAAFVATVWLTPAPRKLSLTAVFVIPFAAWMVMNALDPVDDDNVEFLMQEYDAISAHVVWRTLVDNAHALWVGWCASFDIMGSAIGRVVGAACAALWVAGLSLRLRDRQADAIYVVFYLGVIMVWPNDDHARRFLFPLVPLAFFHCLAFLSRLPEARNRMTPRLYGTGFAVVLIVTAAPSSAAITARLLAPIDPLIADFRRTTAWLTSANAEIAAKNLQLVNLAIESYRLVARHVPAGECVFSVHPELFMLHARRSSYPPPIPSVSDAEFKARIRRCRYVHLLWTATHPYLAPGYPGARLEGGTVVFKTQSTFAAGKVGAYSALVDLRGEAISRDEAHDRPVIAPRASARARRPVVAGAQPVSVGGRRPCTAASP
jgi:hypothetical protein